MKTEDNNTLKKPEEVKPGERLIMMDIRIENPPPPAPTDKDEKISPWKRWGSTLAVFLFGTAAGAGGMYYYQQGKK